MPLKSGRFYIHVVVSVTWVMQTQALLFEIKIRVRFGLFELLVWRHPSHFLSIKNLLRKSQSQAAVVREGREDCLLSHTRWPSRYTELDVE